MYKGKVKLGIDDLSIEEGRLRARKKRMVELAGILKEKKEGTITQLTRILKRFSIQEGVRLVKAKEYLSLFKGVGLIKFSSGSKRWKYNSKAEWELFSISI